MNANSSDPAPATHATLTETAKESKAWLIWFLGVASAVAILVVSMSSWVDAQKVPVITFQATPIVSVGVDVRGAVSTPGVVMVNPGDRLIDVVDRAGGLSPNADLALINLSSRVSDGQMIVLPTQVPPGEFEGDELVNINTASVDELMQLPGIGEVLAARIVAYRETNGPFQSVDDLANIEGISFSLVDKLRPHVRISGGDERDRAGSVCVGRHMVGVVCGSDLRLDRGHHTPSGTSRPMATARVRPPRREHRSCAI